MRFARVRSGLAESFDDVEAVAVDPTGAELFVSGDPDRPMFYRSAIKPLQALAAQRTGLVLPSEHLAVSCASHGGYPAHIGIVRQILADAGLTEAALQATPSRPWSHNADEQLMAREDRSSRPILSPCSGKHAGWLAACVHTGWDSDTYLEPDHPLQHAVFEAVEEFTGVHPGPIGVDGCGAPTLRGSIRGLAAAYVNLITREEMAPIAAAMTRFGALVSDNISIHGRIGAWWGGPQKEGAEGSFVMVRQDVAIATKSMSGNSAIAATAALIVADRLGMLTLAMKAALEPQLRPPVLGAGRTVGHLELVES